LSWALSGQLLSERGRTIVSRLNLTAKLPSRGRAERLKWAEREAFGGSHSEATQGRQGNGKNQGPTLE
jgi:hypothetical protein